MNSSASFVFLSLGRLPREKGYIACSHLLKSNPPPDKQTSSELPIFEWTEICTAWLSPDGQLAGGMEEEEVLPGAATHDSMASSSILSATSPLEAAHSSDIDVVQAWENLLSAPEEHHFENGRRYHMFRQGRYPIPNDEDEQVREDMKHAMLLELTGGKLFYAPIGDSPEKIMDIGTGTVADVYPGAEVLGTDLSAIQPDLVPPNVRFVVDDVEDPEWLNGSNWDLIHLRMVSGSLIDIQGVFNRCYEHIRPGGWIELQDMHAFPQCDDNTMKPDDFLLGFYKLVHQSFNARGMDHRNRPKEMKSYLQQAGFTNIKCIVKKTPVGPWAKGDQLQRIGECMKYAIYDLLPSLVKPLEAIEISRIEAEVWFVKVRKTLEDNSIHRYFNYYFWYAQKPGPDERTPTHP
ncbi:hypothetical protein OOU_Y34scaffold00484g3 [Pyricularia oryzae Y34]|uniref:Methyltransferase domain-containing protein n=2 Tax=Pyricularia oryzae TaxID=318829 RepID=A0AA97P0M9_PYRO3|nr:hypothetical protein OOU_Y34scaffold00484g3 [Pyricularia oryzae Y34]